MNFPRAIFPLIILGIFLSLSFYSPTCAAKPEFQQVPPKMLVFSKTEGFRHSSIAAGAKAVTEIAKERDITAVHTENTDYFHSDSLAQFDIVMFLNTTGDILNDQQQGNFEQYIQEGGGFVGIHAATDTEYEWPWYGKLVGAYFESHPRVQEANISVIDRDHPATSFLPEEWVRTDEWYNFRNINPDLNVILNLEESSYEGGKNGENHPISWYHEYEGGRIFYTGGGHTKSSYEEPLFRQHIGAGIDYVLSEGELLN